MTGQPGVELARGTHPNHYRCGQWAQVVGRGELNGRPVVEVVFDDGATDTWVADDADNPLEFRNEPTSGADR